jgi:hypothetical protein
MTSVSSSIGCSAVATLEMFHEFIVCHGTFFNSRAQAILAKELTTTTLPAAAGTPPSSLSLAVSAA